MEPSSTDRRPSPEGSHNPESPRQPLRQGGRVRTLARAGIVAAVYGAISVVVMQTMAYLSWGPIQFRLSEALTILPMFWSAAVPGLTVGTMIANLYNLSMTGALGWLDVVFGTLATLLGALWTLKFRSRPALAMAGPVVTNALIVAAYLPVVLAGLGLYQLPLLGIDFEGNYLTMYAFGIVAVGFGQAVVVYGLGMPLYYALRRNPAFRTDERNR